MRTMPESSSSPPIGDANRLSDKTVRKEKE